MTAVDDVCAYTAVCEEDAGWVDQYLAEVERLGVCFVVHLDRCSVHTQERLRFHRLCQGYTFNAFGEFSEMHKQQMFDLVVRLGFTWAMPWDVDETWEPDFLEKIERLDPVSMEHVDCPWLNLWEAEDRVRVDGTFGGGHRVKFYNLRCGLTWKFLYHQTNGAQAAERKSYPSKLNIVSVHHGMRTKELRLFHKARWDRIYTKWAGVNPSGFWDFALDESVKVKTVSLAQRLRDFP